MEILKVGQLGEYQHQKHYEATCTDPISHIFVSFNHARVRLNHETEFVIGISGEVCCSPGFVKYINSLTFHTNERKHEVFHIDPKSGVPERAEIHSGLNDRREFGGFFGSCSYGALDSIGLYIRPVISSVDTIKQENV
ncbi:unnamed protein product [Arabis nemorensis]|uniref:Jacalin-type lectin domain-containing protein n=1 Tax=Arabis nemorensis TaxID=586526 RepID=A0A565BQ70_9BRAS|nr:unnamed protein product [Arabis nemorensis]